MQYVVGVVLPLRVESLNRHHRNPPESQGSKSLVVGAKINLRMKILNVQPVETVTFLALPPEFVSRVRVLN